MKKRVIKKQAEHPEQAAPREPSIEERLSLLEQIFNAPVDVRLIVSGQKVQFESCRRHRSDDDGGDEAPAEFYPPVQKRVEIVRGFG